MHPLISWRSVVAGLLIAFFMMVGLIGLGMAFGGIRSLNFTGVWFLSSALVSIFTGSYFAARVSKFQAGRIGSAQGLVIASLFLGFFLYETVSTLVMNGKSTQKPVLDEISQEAELTLGELNLHSGPEVVAKGLATRLIRGNLESAKNYLARETGITQDEASLRIADLRTRADRAEDHAKESAAAALKATGWSLFLLVMLGALASVLGGALGSVANFRNPLGREQFAAHHRLHAHAP
ncbi:MAG: hypothetical protein ACJ76H_02565 [Bacteriovoracaceae bacterium]